MWSRQRVAHHELPPAAVNRGSLVESGHSLPETTAPRRRLLRIASGTAVFLAGVLMGALAQLLLEPWLPSPHREHASLGVATAIWFTFGRAWLQLRTLPRVLLVLLGSVAFWMSVGPWLLALIDVRL